MIQNDLFETWYPYWEWECYQHGMYDARTPKKEFIVKAKEILSDEVKCFNAMIKAVINFPKSSNHHLSKYSVNRNPFMGQSACCIECKATEEETRIAWCQLTYEQQIKANLISQQVIKMWESGEINAKN